MSQDDSDKLNRLEELKSKLFSKNFQMKIEHKDSFSHLNQTEIPDSWQTTIKEQIRSNEQQFSQSHFAKNFFIFAIIVFFITIAYASYVFFAGGNTVSKDNIEISVLGNSFVAGGEELPLVIGITNKNSSAIDLVDLIVEYPKSSTLITTDTSTQMQRIRKSLGTIPSGAVRNENVKLVLFGEQGSLVSVKISIEYRVEGSNAIFVKDKTYEVSINSTPVNLVIDAPDSVSSNQDVVLNIKTTLNSTNTLYGVLVKVDYPLGFQFKSANPSPTLGNNIWDMGDLAPGADHNISVVGQMVDVFEGEEKIFRVWSGTQSKSDKSVMDIIFNSLAHSISIKKPFIQTKLLINGVAQREYAIDSKTTIRGEINWTNNLDTNVNDFVIRARITGNAVDRKTINGVLGFYDSTNNIITWDKTYNNKFKEINPGDSGSVTFSFSPLSLLSTPGQIINNPSVNIDIDVVGKQALDGFNVKDLTNSESAVIHIISNAGLATKALYYSGPFTNTGSISPKVGQETTYTMVWTLSNSANNLSKAKVISTLPPWMRFVGSLSPASEDLVYNPSTKEISWNIGNIPRGLGITSPSREVAFQIAITPSLSQVGSLPVIINDATLTGHDDFANVDVRVNKPSLRTRLENDSAFPSWGGMVTE
ncbi:MAG: hypothetical protein KA515_00385 [Candidatus Pacebacteria bacterium]|nr:hypothetical protein [Candidatus Paceibacterota bacterium]